MCPGEVFPYIAKKSLERAKSPNELAKKMLEWAKIEPVYHNPKERDKFLQDQEGGIAISNHPGFPDTLIIFHIISGRDDFKIIAGPDEYQRLNKVMPDNIILASKRPKELRKTIDLSLKHIRNKGVLFLFPTGGTDYVDSCAIKPIFQNLFTYLIPHLADEQMVHSIHVNQYDIKILHENMYGGLTQRKLAAMLCRPFSYLIEDFIQINVREKCLPAGFWKKSLENIQKQYKNSKLPINSGITKVYLDLFNIPDLRASF